MRKRYLLFSLALLAFGTAMAQNNATIKPKLSPVTRLYLKEAEMAAHGTLPEGYLYRRHADGRTYLPGMIKVADAAPVAASLDALGVIVGTKAGDIWTVQVPVEKALAFSVTTGISYIQLDEPVKPMLDWARKTTRVDSVHGGYALPQPFTGKNVVVGVIDFGFDYNHPTFFDTTGTQYRVKKVWELNSTGTPPAGFTYGHEITGTAAIQAQGTDNPVQTHGTAVAGMAAGSGYGSGNDGRKLRGMAFESDMVFVGVRRDSIGGQWMSSGFSDFVDGINYIFQYAASVGKPAVVNISWGSQSGPHDGSTLMNQACNNLSGPGKTIVMSAGNEGQEWIHYGKAFTATDTVVNTFVTFSPNDYKRTWVDAWGETGKTFCGKVTLYKNGVAGNTTGYICLDDQVHSLYLIGANGLDTCYAEFITSTSEFNGKPRLTINLFNKAADSMAVSFKGTSGTIHMWDEYYYYGYKYRYSSSFESLNKTGFISGNSISTVSDMGAASSVLLVGAYASKIVFTDINGVNRSYSGYVLANQLVPFSSRGPMVDNTVRPDITAPGLTIATAISSYDTSYTPTGTNSDVTVSSFTHPVSGKKFYFAEFLGTSASAPAASGVVALMLQANPSLTPQMMKSIVAETAIEDNATGNVPPAGNNNWGHGKINAYGAVKKALQASSVYTFSGEKLDCALFPNPGSGNFTLEYTGRKTETLHIEIVSMAGSVVRAFDRNATAGVNRYPVDLKDLARGTYLLKVAAGNGAAVIKTTLN